ncbi:unnamed protein product, partial [Prorocentrum cordatum]
PRPERGAPPESRAGAGAGRPSPGCGRAPRRAGGAARPAPRVWVPRGRHGSVRLGSSLADCGPTVLAVLLGTAPWSVLGVGHRPRAPMGFAVALASILAVGAWAESWEADLRRAKQRVPRAEWRGQGTLASANAKLNEHLAANQNLRLKACEQFTVTELRATLRHLFLHVSEELWQVYQHGDGRQPTHTNLSDIEAHWELHAPADDVRVRDAHCHEAVMWFVHHLTSENQRRVQTDLVLPMLPINDHAIDSQLRGSQDKAGAFYTAKTTCQKCHVVGPPGSSVDTKTVQTPILSSRFHVGFVEYTAMLKPLPWQHGKTNSGSVHYDFEGRRQVWFHGKGQTDNWCQCAGLKTDEPCHLIAAPSQGESGGGATYIAFKTLGKCCKLGAFDQGFGPLRPDWLSGSKRTGQVRVGNRSCDIWSGGPPGDTFMMVSDDWGVDEKGHPCQYSDHFKSWARVLFGMAHNYTFDDATYSEAVEHDDVFAIPSGIGCENECPNTAGGWCKAPAPSKEILV